MTDCTEPTLLADQGPGGCPRYEYRGVAIQSENLKGTVTRLDLPGHPFHNMPKGVAGTWCSIVDAWLDHGRLPPWYKTTAASAG